jgi:hypothetical protein
MTGIIGGLLLRRPTRNSTVLCQEVGDGRHPSPGLSLEERAASLQSDVLMPKRVEISSCISTLYSLVVTVLT